MWLITGPFDGELGDVTTTKTKLLKTGCKVSLGRKEQPLLVVSKKISRENCQFTVGPCTPDDILDPSFVPTLELFNAKEKPMTVKREGQALVVNPLSSYSLKSGDKITIVVGVSIEVNWRRVACFLPPTRTVPSISTEDCAAMGISLISSPSSLATHHLTPKYELTVPLATSLLSATQLVKFEWLQELVRLGSTPDDNHQFKHTPLEQTFTPPLESKYRPVFSPSLAPSLKSFKFWEPNEERLHLLRGYRFVLLSDSDGSVDSDLRELIVRGDGEYECFPMTSGQAKWNQLLAKAKRKLDETGLKVVIVARERVVQTTVGTDQWNDMLAGAQSLSLPLVNADAIMNAVIHTNTSLINEGSLSQAPFTSSESPLPDVIPNTHPDEPSLPEKETSPKAQVDVDKKSPPPSSPPAVLLGLPLPPPPSKTLRRRAKPPSMSSRTEEPPPAPVKDEPQAENLGFTLPPLPTMARSSRLKRRTPAPTPAPEKSIANDEPSQEPPLKKFKALFDASDPDKMAVDSPNSIQEAYDVAMRDSVGTTQDGDSLTQSESRPLQSQMHAAPSRRLGVVAEEEEEESVRSQVKDATPAVAAPPPAPPREPEPQAAPRVEASQAPAARAKPPSKQAKATKSGQKSGQPHQVDKDEVFLTALASRKGGKKTAEDEFDREFNKLRISKPDIHREEEEKAWEVLGDFDMEEARNIRGNFMVVIDMEVYRKPGQTRSTVVSQTHDGKPNYKKFKKTPTPSSRAPIELVAKTENDYGVGSGYWKDSGINAKDYTSLPPTQTIGTQKRRALTVLESDEGEGSDVPVVKKPKRTTAKASQPKASAAAKRLFLESDEEGSAPDAESQGVATRSRGRRGVQEEEPAAAMPTRGSKRRHIIADDDSDDGVAFKGFGKKRRVR